MKKSMFRRSFCAALSAAMLLGVCACSGGTDISGGLSDSTTNLMANVKPEADALSFGKNSERQRVFEWDYDEFALSLFRKCAAKDPKKKRAGFTAVGPDGACHDPKRRGGRNA